MLTMKRPLVGAVATSLAAVAMLLAVPAGTPGLGAEKAEANYALGCLFNAGNPYVASNGKIYSTLQVRCDQTRWLSWHSRMTKDRFGPDLRAGGFDGRDLFEAGQVYTWWVYNDEDNCPGSGDYFGKLTIQATALSQAYEDRSANVRLSHC